LLLYFNLCFVVSKSVKHHLALPDMAFVSGRDTWTHGGYKMSSYHIQVSNLCPEVVATLI
jgi:hypothetical protein